MSAKVIDGKAFAARLRQRIAADVARLKERRGITPGLAVILVGEDAASQVYVRAKGRACDEAGMHSRTITLPFSTSQNELLAQVESLNNDPAIHGILVQLPLPPAIDPQAVIAAIDPAKDVDGFHPVNAGKLAIGDPSGFVPCTPLGCLMLLEDHFGAPVSPIVPPADIAASEPPVAHLRGDTSSYGGQQAAPGSNANNANPLRGLRAVVIGRSNIVGKPMSLLLLGADCTVTTCHRYSGELEPFLKDADIVVVAVGKPEFIRGDWLKPGCVVIDVGINRLDPDATNPKGRLVGDMNYQEALQVASAVTPVPGGVGPMTIACLLFNTLKAAVSLDAQRAS